MDFRKVLQNAWSVALVALIVGFVSVGQVSAQNKTYYVNGAIGQDTNDGSQMADGGGNVGGFKTIAKAITVAVDTDTIVILAGTYAELLAVGESLTFQVQVSGGNTKAIVNGITKTVAAKTMTISGTGVLEINTTTLLTLTAGAINVVGNTLSLQSAALLVRTAGSLTGTVPSFGAILFSTYNGATSITAGNELPANIGAGTVNFSNTAGTVTVPNALSASDLFFNAAGSVTFAGAVVTTGIISGNAAALLGTVTFQSTVTMGGGFFTNALTTKVFNFQGATSVTGADFQHTGSSVVTLASLDVNAQDLLNSNANGTVTVTGALTVGDSGTAIRVNNDGTMNLGSVVASADDTPANDADRAYLIDNAAGKDLTISGAITEYHVADVGGGGGDILDRTFGLTNATGGSIGIGAATTLGGQINNLERDAGADGDGIVLSNNAVLTLNDQAGAGNLTSIGDIVGGTVVFDYINGSTDATVGGGAGGALTTANNVTFTSKVTANAAAGVLTVLGNVRFQEATHTWNTVLTVTGTVFVEANAQSFTNAGLNTMGGYNAGTTTGSAFTGAVTITGSTATLSNTTFAAAYIAAAANTTATAGATFGAAVSSLTFSVSGAGTVTVATTFDIGGAATVAAGTTLTLTNAGATSDIDGALTVNGTMNVQGVGRTLTVASVVIHATTGLLAYNNVSTLTVEGNFTGGTFTGATALFIFNVPGAGASFAPKPGTTIGGLTVNGNLRTLTLSESIIVSGNVVIGTDAIIALGINSIVMSLANATFTITDEARITNSGTDGSVQFNATNQTLTTAGTPTTNPTFQNITINYAGGTPLKLTKTVNITGTLFLVDGGMVISATMALNFTGTSGAINRQFPNEGITGAGAPSGVWDVTYSGAPAAGVAAAGNTAGTEWPTTGVRNVTVAATNVYSPATARTITGSLSVSTNAALFNMQHNLTVPLGATFTGSGTIANTRTLAVGGAFSLAGGETLISSGAASTLSLTGNSQTHTVSGQIGAGMTTSFSGTTVVMNGVAAGTEANGASELQNVTALAGSSVTMNNIQVVNGNVVVTGTLALNLIVDLAAGVADINDGTLAGTTTVNNLGSFTLNAAAIGATDEVIGAVTVSDGGTFTMGSSLEFTGLVTVGNGTQTTASVFNLNGMTATANGGATVVLSAAPATAPTFGTTGTLSITAGQTYTGTATPSTIPNFTLNGTAAPDLAGSVDVTGNFNVTASSVGGVAANKVRLVGATAIARLAGNFTVGTLEAMGSTVTSVGGFAPTITNLIINSTGTVAFTNTVAGAVTFTVGNLVHTKGVVGMGAHSILIAGDNNAATTDWTYTAGSYTATTGAIIITDTGNNQEIDIATGGATVSVRNLITTNTAAGTGLQINTGDTVTVTGTLTLSGNIQTEATPAADGTFTVANGATIIVTVNPVAVVAGGLFDNAPTLGTGLTVRYTFVGAATTSTELPTTLARLEWEGGNNTLTLADAVALTVDYLESGGLIQIDANNDGDNSIAITAGGTIEYDTANSDFGLGTAAAIESPTAAGALTLFFNGSTFTTTDRTWRNEYTGSTLTLQFSGAGSTMTMHENKSAGAVTVGDGAGGTATLATGATTLTATSLTVAVDGVVTGTVNVSGAITSAGVTAGTVIIAQGNVTITGAAPGALTFNGTTAQTFTIPAAGLALVANMTLNNAAGVTLAGGNLTTLAGNAGFTLTQGVLTTGARILIITHGGSGVQGFTQATGCVFGNVRKLLSATGGGTGAQVADRLQYPLCSVGGTLRTFAVTFNDPGVINAAAPTVTVRHDRGGEGGATDITGINGLPQTVNGVSVARYPTGPTFFWTVTPSFTMSPSLNYDVELRGNNYTNWSTSCLTAACDINQVYPMRRHVGSPSNLWSIASSTIDNFLSAANSPVVIGRGATGALQTSGTIFTMGLKQIFTNVAGTTLATTNGSSTVVDLTTLFTGFTGTLTYTSVVSGDATIAAVGTLAGNNQTITGGASAGSATVTIIATDSFGSSATATITVTNSATLAVAAATADQTLNVGGTYTGTWASVFSGGSATVGYTAVSSSAAATVATTATGFTVTAAATAGSPATITLTATDQSTTPVVITDVFTVTVNAIVTVATATADASVVQGGTSVTALAGMFTGGTVATAYTYTVSSATPATATVVSDGTNVTVTGVAAYAGAADSAPVTITVTATDDLGALASDTYDITVTPIKGDVDGSGGPSAFGAGRALDHFLGIAVPAFTANQIAAADYDGDSDVDAFDAYQIWQASIPPKRDVDAFVASRLGFADVSYDGNLITIPIVADGNLDDVASVSFSTVIDPSKAKIVDVNSSLEDWMFKHTLNDAGELRLAAVGVSGISADGIIGTITIEMTAGTVEFSLSAEGAINNNPVSMIEGIEVVELPETFTLDGNYPNPFNPTTTIQFDLPETADVEIQVFNMLGRRVLVLPVQTVQAGAKRSIQLNASSLASGSYFYRLIAKMENKTAVDSGRLTLIK